MIALQVPVHTTIVRQTLSHNWLEKLLLRNADYVARLHTRSKDDEARQDFEGFIQPGGEYERWITQAKELAENMVEGFGPAQLVDRGPLAVLSDAGRTLLKEVLHRAYLEATGIESLKEPLRKALETCEDAFRAFQETWRREPSAPPDDVKTAFDGLLTAARGLLGEVEKLPKGVVLP